MIRRAISASVKYSPVAAPVCPLGKLEVGGESSSFSTSGRSRSMRSVVKKKTIACRLIAMSGTTAYHHCLVRRQTSTTTTRHTPMMLTVAPVHEKKSVTAFQNVVRDDSRLLLTLSSEVPRSFSGPSVRSQPIASTTSHHTDDGSQRADRQVTARLLGGGSGRVVLPAGEQRHQSEPFVVLSVGVGGRQPT